MTFLNKSFFIVTIFVAYIVVVFATKARIGNKVCKVSKKQLFNGTQNPKGECVTTVMGEIPDENKMCSTIILFPRDGQIINANTPFTIRTKTTNLITGFFDDPAKEYYLFPQTLNKRGFIQGHSHVTVQKISSPNKPLDPRNPAFFKGLNEKADRNGELTAKVPKGLPPGDYRLCTMVSSFAHQPVLMPIAKRGSQDDCVRFKVVRPKTPKYPIKCDIFILDI